MPGRGLPNVGGTSQNAGDYRPLHVLIVGEDGVPIDAATADFWHTSHAPVADTKATITKAAAGASVRNVCRQITVMLVAGTSAPAAATVTVALIDGAAGGGTYLWGPARLSVPALAGATSGIAIAVNKIGSANTAMTLEFSAAAGANTFQSVSMDGVTL